MSSVPSCTRTSEHARRDNGTDRDEHDVEQQLQLGLGDTRAHYRAGLPCASLAGLLQLRNRLSTGKRNLVVRWGVVYAAITARTFATGAASGLGTAWTNVIARRGVLDSEVAFIQKPFTSNGLAAKIRQLLE